MDVATFRQNFPEFTGPDAYPDPTVQFWLDDATLALKTNQLRWGNRYDMGLQLYVGHMIALERQAQLVAAKGGIPGLSTGPINSKSVGPVSVGYDTAAGLDTDAGHWNLTIYGTRFIRLARMVGTGGIQIW